jgi:hypothetical protein
MPRLSLAFHREAAGECLRLAWSEQTLNGICTEKDLMLRFIYDAEQMEAAMPPCIFLHASQGMTTLT